MDVGSDMGDTTTTTTASSTPCTPRTPRHQAAGLRHDVPAPLPGHRAPATAAALAAEVRELQQQLVFSRQELEVAKGVIASQHAALHQMNAAHRADREHFTAAFTRLQKSIDARKGAAPHTRSTSIQTERIQCTDPADASVVCDFFDPTQEEDGTQAGATPEPSPPNGHACTCGAAPSAAQAPPVGRALRALRPNVVAGQAVGGVAKKIRQQQQQQWAFPEPPHGTARSRSRSRGRCAAGARPDTVPCRHQGSGSRGRAWQQHQWGGPREAPLFSIHSDGDITASSVEGADEVVAGGAASDAASDDCDDRILASLREAVRLRG